MLAAVALSILADIPSGPLALSKFNTWMKAKISLGVHNRSSGQLAQCASSDRASGDRGSTVVLKQVPKKSFNISAFSSSDFAVLS